MRVLGVDPGTKACGVALWCDEKFVDVRTIRPTARDLPSVVREVCTVLSQIPPVDLLVVEGQQVYAGDAYKAKGVIMLATIAGGVIATVPAQAVFLPTPCEWKGQLPKDVHHARLRARMPELPACSQDAMDAIGLALWGMRRFYRA